MFFFFFFNDTATTEIYTLSLHDALPISGADISPAVRRSSHLLRRMTQGKEVAQTGDRKSTRLNSSHGYISYAVFCLKKKKINDASKAAIATSALRFHSSTFTPMLRIKPG